MRDGAMWMCLGMAGVLIAPDVWVELGPVVGSLLGIFGLG